MSEALPDKLHIQLKIGNDLHPITIRPELEETFRQAARNINEKLGRYREAYPSLTYEKCVSMTLLDFAVYALQATKDNSTAPYDAALRKLTDEVEAALGLPSSDTPTPTKTNEDSPQTL